jgi:hypothetical protein
VLVEAFGIIHGWVVELVRPRDPIVGERFGPGLARGKERGDGGRRFDDGGRCRHGRQIGDVGGTGAI